MLASGDIGTVEEAGNIQRRTLRDTLLREMHSNNWEEIERLSRTSFNINSNFP